MFFDILLNLKILMKKTLLILILSIYNSFFSFGQQTISETEKLASLGKIYGFLKYYHPEVGKGTYNWDNEFIKYLPKVLNATDKEDLSTIYINWIDSLGEIDVCKKCSSEENYFNKNFDLSWLQDTILFNDELSSKLKYIEGNRIQKENFYVETQPVGNIKLTNEPEYKNFEFPDEEYRLLGLFKYWNVIEYFYPYKYLTDQNWDSVLEEMIPKFKNAQNQSEYQSKIKELVAKLDDTHAWISFDDKATKYLPVKFSNIDDKAVISGIYNDFLAKENNLKLGDIILKINDKDVRSETEAKLKYISASTINGKIIDAYYRTLNGAEDVVRLTILRNDKTLSVTANRYDFNDFNYWNNPNAETSKDINGNIGYINMANVKVKDVDDIFKSFGDKKTIIIDLRNYPAWVLYQFSRYFNSQKKDFSKIYSPNINYPGKFIYKENLKTNSSKKAFKGKIILLVNGESLSRSEFTAMAFQTADNVITVGNQTAGADGDVVVFEYMGGFRTAISGNGILYPDGSQTQRKGVKIDVEVKPTINGLIQGRDEILDRAIELANE